MSLVSSPVHAPPHLCTPPHACASVPHCYARLLALAPTLSHTRANSFSLSSPPFSRACPLTSPLACSLSTSLTVSPLPLTPARLRAL